MEFEEEYFKKIYNQPYYKRNPRYKIRQLVREIRKYKKNGKLLDIGCAYGLFLKEAEKYYGIKGADISKYAIDIAKKNLNCELKARGIINTGFGKEMFDVVTVFDVLEHVKDLNSAFRELYKITKKEGIIIITVPVYEGLIGKVVKRIDHDPTHIHKRGRNFWFRIAKKHNFRIINYTGIFRYFLLHKYYIQFLSQIFKKHSPAIMLILKKQ